MSLLLDTSILIRFFEEESDMLPDQLLDAVGASRGGIHASVASLWEIALKARVGKLPLKKELHQLPSMIEELEMILLQIDHRHVLAELHEIPPTRDPFDQLLLAQCQVENLRLVTLDRALGIHPLAWRAP